MPVRGRGQEADMRGRRSHQQEVLEARSASEGGPGPGHRLPWGRCRERAVRARCLLAGGGELADGHATPRSIPAAPRRQRDRLARWCPRRELHVLDHQDTDHEPGPLTERTSLGHALNGGNMQWRGPRCPTGPSCPGHGVIDHGGQHPFRPWGVSRRYRPPAQPTPSLPTPTASAPAHATAPRHPPTIPPAPPAERSSRSPSPPPGPRPSPSTADARSPPAWRSACVSTR